MYSLDVRELDGPRPVRPEERVAVRRLDALCFPGFVDETEDGEPLPRPDAPARTSRFSGDSSPPIRSFLNPLLAPSRTSRFSGDSSRHEDIEVLCYRGTPISKIGIYYSQVNVYGSPLRLASIGGVCTHPDYQGQGLATRLLDHCARKLTAEGARLMLISGMRGLYTRAGYVTAQDYGHVVLRPGLLRPAADNLSLRPATEADAALCARLYHKEPVHFVRRVEKFTRHFHQRERFPQAEDWIVEVEGACPEPVEGRPAAYIFSGIPWEYWPATCASVQEVVEYAGSRVALVGGLARIMAHRGLREMRLLVPWQDADFLQLLREQGIAGNHSPLDGHTMRIVNFPGLMSDLRPYVRARLTESQRRGLRFGQGAPLSAPVPGALPGALEGHRYAIVRGRERIGLDGIAMTRLVMGIPAEMAPDLAVRSGALGEIVTALFPLPAFLPGLNYQ